MSDGSSGEDPVQRVYIENDTELNSEESETTLLRAKRRMNYSLNFKKEVADYADLHNISKAARKFGVPRQCVQKWKLSKNDMRTEIAGNDNGKKKRLEGAGRHVKDSDFDKTISTWIQNQRANKIRVTRSAIQMHARSLNKEFRASNGWLESFLRRHKLVSRRPTSVCQKPPEEYVEKIVGFLLYTEKIILSNNYTHIYASDETAVYLDFSNSLTVDSKGAKQVMVSSTGHDKLHVTVMLTARSDGMKCRPFVLLPNKRPIPEIVKQFEKQMELCWCARTFFNDQITTNYLQSIIGTSLFGKRLLVWDSYRCHISEETKKTLKKQRIDTAVVPGGTTKFIQAADVYWNSPFKARVRSQYEDWMIHGVKSYTKRGNMKAPSMEVYLNWIVNAWDSLPVDLIKRSFVGCGLKNGKDGVDDSSIHCFRESEEMAAGLELLKQKREKGISLDSMEKRMGDITLDNGNCDEEENSDCSIDIID